MSILIKGMEMPPNAEGCEVIIRIQPNGEVLDLHGFHIGATAIPVPDHGGLFDVNQFEKGYFYGYGLDGRVYKLFWDKRVFEGAKKFYINPIIPADKESGE